ncbi:MAG: hypothetical protein JWP01_4186 [Myxococcales bacterium]|nr:hypothetical protein [Myxococcales bacterium]
MPWNVLAHTGIVALVLTGACTFDADYSRGTYKCSDGRCPSALVCDTRSDTCVAALPIEDAPGDSAVDARMAALTCTDPGLLTSGVAAAGDTTGRTSRVSAWCGGFVMNGADEVYRITPAAGDQFLVEVTGMRAYVVTPCGSTAGCLGNHFASQGNPIVVTALVGGPLFVVVDHELAPTVGAYTVTVTKQ